MEGESSIKKRPCPTQQELSARKRFDFCEAIKNLLSEEQNANKENVNHQILYSRPVSTCGEFLIAMGNVLQQFHQSNIILKKLDLKLIRSNTFQYFSAVE